MSEFYQPESVEEACELIVEHPDGKLVAGAQSLSPLLQSGLVDPDTFIAIDGIDQLDYVELHEDDDVKQLRIGAGTTWATLHTSETVDETIPALGRVCGEIGDVQVRNRGTIGGSISHADPAQDVGAFLRLLDCEVVVQSTNGKRIVPLSEFFKGMFAADIQEDELLVEVRVTVPPSNTAQAYEKFEYRRGGFTMVGVGADVANSEDAGTYDVRGVALANCGEGPVVVEGPSSFDPDSDEQVAAVREAVIEAADPTGDEYGSREYMQRLAGNLAVQCINDAITTLEDER